MSRKASRDEMLWLKGGAVVDPEQPERLFCKNCYDDDRLTELQRLPEKARRADLGTHSCHECNLFITIRGATEIPGLAAKVAERNRDR